MRGFHAWLKAGDVVRKGQKGIKIVAPVMGGDDGGKVVNIKPAYVFDVSQTDELTQRAAAYTVLQDAPGASAARRRRSSLQRGHLETSLTLRTRYLDLYGNRVLTGSGLHPASAMAPDSPRNSLI